MDKVGVPRKDDGNEVLEGWVVQPSSQVLGCCNHRSRRHLNASLKYLLDDESVKRAWTESLSYI